MFELSYPLPCFFFSLLDLRSAQCIIPNRPFFYANSQIKEFTYLKVPCFFSASVCCPLTFIGCAVSV